MSEQGPTVSASAAVLEDQYAVLTSEWPLVVRHRVTGSVRVAQPQLRQLPPLTAVPPALQCLYDQVTLGDDVLCVVADHRQLQSVDELPPLTHDEALHIGRGVAAVVLALEADGLEHGALWPAGVRVRRGVVPHVVVRRPELCQYEMPDCDGLKAVLSRLAHGIVPASNLSAAWEDEDDPRGIYESWRSCVDPVGEVQSASQPIYLPTETVDDLSDFEVDQSTVVGEVVGRVEDIARIQQVLDEPSVLVGLHAPKGTGVSTILATIAQQRGWAMVKPTPDSARAWRTRLDALVVDLGELSASEATSFVRELRERYPSATLLTGHHEPLDLPGGRSVSILPLSPASARRLFFSTALSLSPSVDLVRDQASVDQICELVGWLPGAVRQAAIQTRERSCAAIADMLRLQQPSVSGAPPPVEEAEPPGNDQRMSDVRAELRVACARILDSPVPLHLDELGEHLEPGVTMFEVLDVLLGRGLASIDPVTGCLARNAAVTEQ